MIDLVDDDRWDIDSGAWVDVGIWEILGIYVGFGDFVGFGWKMGQGWGGMGMRTSQNHSQS